MNSIREYGSCAICCRVPALGTLSVISSDRLNFQSLAHLLETKLPYYQYFSALSWRRTLGANWASLGCIR